MTHALGLNAKARRNERLWHTQDINNIFRLTSDFDNSQ